MARARTSNDVWWSEKLNSLDRFDGSYPIIPKEPLAERSLPFLIGSRITIKNYNIFLLNHGSSGYKFWFQLNNDNKTGNVYIIDMTSAVHERVIFRLQKFFEVPNNGVVDFPPILIAGQILHNVPSGTGVWTAPDILVQPDMVLVPKPSTSTVVPRPPGDLDGNPHARIICEVAVGQDASRLSQKCISWMQEQYVRDVVSIKILEPRRNVQEPRTGYFFRTMTAKLYHQGMAVQQWDFGNARKNSRDPVGDFTNDPALCRAPNDPNFQISIPISDVFWDPPFPIPPTYIPMIPTNVAGHVFNIDLYLIQRCALRSHTL
ncbi:hypothetical protein C1645_737519 [Glomus cerebriforme]|uniref:Uncharacterized protein n=1 Tax=Glomus cerebriforme TaxID=658196 RepID=A0A397T3Z7_9GLOM|nr:hypothetical protein C1645_737519 [Glomus cerebriforme]